MGWPCLITMVYKQKRARPIATIETWIDTKVYEWKSNSPNLTGDIIFASQLLKLTNTRE